MVTTVCDACNRTEDEAHRQGLYCCLNCAWTNPDYATRPIPPAPFNWPGFLIASLIVVVFVIAAMVST